MQGGTPFKGTVVTPSYTFKIFKCCCFTTKILMCLFVVPVPRTWSVGMKEVALFSCLTKGINHELSRKPGIKQWFRYV